MRNLQEHFKHAEYMLQKQVHGYFVGTDRKFSSIILQEVWGSTTNLISDQTFQIWGQVGAFQ